MDGVFGTDSLSADSEEKHEPVSDIDTVLVDSLKALDPERPIREADIHSYTRHQPFNSGGRVRWATLPPLSLRDERLRLRTSGVAVPAGTFTGTSRGTFMCDRLC